MPVISHGSPATGNRWPLVLWSGQLVVVVPIVFYGLLRATNGPPLGSLILPVWLGSIVWLALVAGVLATRCGRLWIVTHRHQLLLSAMTTILAVLILGEAAIRVVGRSDEDGNFFVRGHHVSPRRLPVKRIEAAERIYRASSSAFMIEDELLGWAPRPGIQTGQYTYNAEGIRVTSSDISYGEIPRNGTIRISLFGDSFTNGAEVSDGETWGEYTGAALRERGQAVEVLNFGVNGYGMDQAYLRWRYTGIRYKPTVVVFGLQLENAKRNINLIRPMYLRFTELLPFTKPRFIVEGAELRLINSPVVPLKDLPDIVRNLEAWPLVRYEGYYDPAKFRARPWSATKAVAFAADVIGEIVSAEGDDNVATAAERDLALRILDAFSDSVKAIGAHFIVYYLPRRHELRSLRSSGTVPDAVLLQEMQKRFDFLSPADALQKEVGRTSIDALYQEGGHYSPAGNRVIASVLAERLSGTVHAGGTR